VSFTKCADESPFDSPSSLVDDTTFNSSSPFEPNHHRWLVRAAPQGPSRDVPDRVHVQAVVITDDPGKLEPPAVVAPGAAAVKSEHTGGDRHLGVGDRSFGVGIDDLTDQCPSPRELYPEGAAGPRVQD
jgi:hypothetical protein